MDNSKRYRYQLTFPFEGNKIYKSSSSKDVVKKCYNEFKTFSDIGEGLFCITNLDKNVEYRFQAKDRKIKKIKHNQAGGNDDKHPHAVEVKVPSNLKEEVKAVIELEGEKEDKFKEIKKPDPNPQVEVLTKKVDALNTHMTKHMGETAKEMSQLMHKISESSEEEKKLIRMEQKTMKEAIDASQEQLDKIIENTKHEEPERVERVDIYADVGDMDVFNTKLSELYALQKLKYIEELQGKNENECIIF
jgi:hypothetical protein